MSQVLREAYNELTAKLGQFARIASSRILGTRLSSNGGHIAVRSLEDARLLYRCELNAITRILVDKKIVTENELVQRMCEEMQHRLDQAREEFKDCVSEVTPKSISFDIQGLKARADKEGWPP